MARITKEDVEHIARLARLTISDEEKQIFTKELGEILNYVDELNEAPTGTITPISQIANLENETRTDEVINPQIREQMLKNAPAQQEGFIKVKKIF